MQPCFYFNCFFIFFFGKIWAGSNEKLGAFVEGVDHLGVFCCSWVRLLHTLLLMKLLQIRNLLIVDGVAAYEDSASYFSDDAAIAAYEDSASYFSDDAATTNHEDIASIAGHDAAIDPLPEHISNA